MPSVCSWCQVRRLGKGKYGITRGGCTLVLSTDYFVPPTGAALPEGRSAEVGGVSAAGYYCGTQGPPICVQVGCWVLGRPCALGVKLGQISHGVEQLGLSLALGGGRQLLVADC